MTPNLVVIDTDVWSHLFGLKNQPHPNTGRWRTMLAGKSVVIAAQTRAEVLTWCLIRDFGARRLTTIRSQLDSAATIPVDEAIIQRFAQLTADARRRGDALGAKHHVADRWIAVTALAIGAALLSGDGIFASDPDLALLDRDPP
ncbi:MAG: PIN domain-containing protein [Dermatophilaceae bacterium]